MKLIKHILKTISFMLLMLAGFIAVAFLAIFTSNFVADTLLANNIIKASSHILVYMIGCLTILMSSAGVVLAFITYRE